MTTHSPTQAEAVYQAIQSVKSGNNRAFTVIVDTYLKQVYNYIYKIVQNTTTAEELTQDVFVRVFEKLNTFDNTRPFQPWLMRLTANLTISYLRKVAPEQRQVTLNEDHMTSSANISDASSPMEEAVTTEALLVAMSKVEDKYRTVLMLRYQYEYPYKEIAEMLDTPVNTLKTWFRRGKDQLKEILETETPAVLAAVR